MHCKSSRLLYLFIIFNLNFVSFSLANSNDAGFDLKLTQFERQWLASQSEFTIGIDKHWYPYEFVDDQGEHMGIAADYLEFASYLLNVKFNVVETQDWAEAYSKYKKGEIDILPAIIETEDRLVDTLFTRPYFSTPTVIVSRKNAFYADSLDSLEGKKLALVKGFAIVELVKKNNPDIELVLVDSIKTGLNELDKGNVDAYIGAIAGINSEINKGAFKEIIISSFTPYDLRVSMAITEKYQPFVSILNKTFASMRNRQRTAIANTWLSVQVKKGIELTTILTWGGPPFLLLSMIVIIIIRLNRGLEKEVARRRDAEKRLKHLAQHDELTGLPNRGLFYDLACFSLAKAKREKERHAILFIDIDGFKSVNDQHGHHVGDRLLKMIAKRLSECVRSSDIVARQGGDEFLILLNDNVDLNLVENVATKLVKVLAEAYQIENVSKPMGGLISIGASVGIAIYPDDSENLEALIKLADLAMYQAKSNGKNSFVLASNL